MKVSSNGRYTILNFKKGEVRLFHHNLEQHPIINPKYSLRKKNSKKKKIKVTFQRFNHYYDCEVDHCQGYVFAVLYTIENICFALLFYILYSKHHLNTKDLN